VREDDRVSTSTVDAPPAPPAEAPVAAARARAARPDAQLVAAVDEARTAAVLEATETWLAGDQRVGEHLGAAAEGERLVVHRFASADPAYVGWEWVVALTRASRAKVVTVDDVVLVPGAGAVLAPAWVPFEERVRPGDVGIGDVLPTAEDDPRLDLSREDVAALLDDGLGRDIAIDLSLGRPRVLSREGRTDAAERWWDAEAGPDAAITKAAPVGLSCGGCGFWLRLAGSMGQVFGVCANAYAADDSRVVAEAHACGAHSEAVVVSAPRWADAEVEGAMEITGMEITGADAVGETAEHPVVAHAPGSVLDSTPAEPYGHS